MSDAETSLPRRKGVKTAAIMSFDQSIKKSALIRETKSRNKKLREQMKALGEDDDEDDEEEEPTDESVGKNGKGRGKGKGKGKASAQTGNSTSSDTKSKAKPQKKKADSQEEKNVAEVLRDEERRDMLIGVLHTLYKHPLDTLNVLDLDELEKMYSEAKGSKALEKVPATTAPAKPKAKAPAKTSVKKASEPLPKENPVAWMDSPSKPLLQAKLQSQRAAASPQAKPSKRDLSTSPDRETKRSRSKLPDQPSKSSKPVKKAAIKAKKSTASSGLTERENDDEEIDIDEAMDDASNDNSEAEDPKPRRKKGSTDPKNRPTSGSYKGVERKIVDYALVHTIRIHAQRDMCPGPAEHELYISEAWGYAVLSCRQDPEEWPMDKNHAACVRQRFNSWRSHAHKRIENGIAGAYNLGSSNSPQFVMNRVVKIKDKEFHRNPKGGRKGNYEAPYIAESIHYLYYSGRLPAAVCCKKEFEVTPLPAIAYAAAVIENFINCYGATGRFSKLKKLGVGDLGPSVRMHLDNLELVVHNAPAGCPSLQEDIAKRARLLISPDVPTSLTKNAAGVLSDDDLDDASLTPEEPDQQQKALSASPALSKHEPAVEQSSDAESDAMEVDDDDQIRRSTRKAFDDDESDSGADSKHAEKRGKSRLPLDNLDEEMADAATAQKGNGKGKSTEEESSSGSETDDEDPGLADEVDGAMAGGEKAAEGAKDGDNQKGRVGEEEGEDEGKQEREGRPTGGDVSRPTPQVSSGWDSGLTDLREAEGEAKQVDKPADESIDHGNRSKTGGGTEMDPAGGRKNWFQSTALDQIPVGSGRGRTFGGQNPFRKELSEEENAKRMQDSVAELAAQQEAKEKAAAEEAKASAKAAAKTAKAAKVAKVAKVGKVAKADKADKADKEEKAEKAGKAGKAGKVDKVDTAVTSKKEPAKKTVERKEVAQGQTEQEGETGGSRRQTRSKGRGVSSA